MNQWNVLPLSAECVTCVWALCFMEWRCDMVLLLSLLLCVVFLCIAICTYNRCSKWVKHTQKGTSIRVILSFITGDAMCTICICFSWRCKMCLSTFHITSNHPFYWRFSFPLCHFISFHFVVGTYSLLLLKFSHTQQWAPVTKWVQKANFQFHENHLAFAHNP